MARKPPAPGIPPIPSRRAGRSAVGLRQTPARTALPDLLEAFWGDEADARDGLPRTPVAIMRRAIWNKHLPGASAEAGGTAVNWSVHPAAALLRRICTTMGREYVHV